MSTEPAADHSSDVSDPDALFARLEEYPWDADNEFQGGLSAILGPSPQSEEQITNLTIRARCFYYSRKFGVPVIFDAYKAYRARVGASEPTRNTASASNATSAPQMSSSDPDAPYPSSFAHVVELITKGEPVPGIKDIPDVVLEGEHSESRTQQRRKPWEKSAGSNGPGVAATGDAAQQS